VEYVCVFGLNNTVIDILKVCTSYFFNYNLVFKTVPGKTRSTRVHPSVCTPGTPVYCLCWCTTCGTTVRVLHSCMCTSST